MKRVITTIVSIIIMISITIAVVLFPNSPIYKLIKDDMIVVVSMLNLIDDSSVELEWIRADEDMQDSTKQHMQNLGENYQTLKDSTLLLDNGNVSEIAANLYQYDNETKKEKKIAGNVLNFLELNDKIYCFTYQEKTGEYKLKCLDKRNKKTITLLTRKEHDIESVWHISEEKVYYLTTRNQLMCYEQATKKSELCLEYDFKRYPYTVFFYEDKFLVCANGIVQLVDIKQKRTKEVLDGRWFSGNAMVGDGNKVYVAIDSYAMLGGNYQIEEKESENTGLWEINMDTLEKKKINSERYEGLYLRDGILYDGNFRKIELDK